MSWVSKFSLSNSIWVKYIPPMMRVSQHTALVWQWVFNVQEKPKIGRAERKDTWTFVVHFDFHNIEDRINWMNCCVHLRKILQNYFIFITYPEIISHIWVWSIAWKDKLSHTTYCQYLNIYIYLHMPYYLENILCFGKLFSIRARMPRIFHDKAAVCFNFIFCKFGLAVLRKRLFLKVFMFCILMWHK